MANNLNESALNVPESDEDDGLVNFSQYYFKEWTEVEALYKLTMYNASLDEKANSETSEDESDMEKDSGDEEVDEDCMEILGKALDNMILTKKTNIIYQNPMAEPRCYAELDVLIGADNADNADNDDSPDEDWKSDDMEDDYESSDDESSSLSN